MSYQFLNRRRVLAAIAAMPFLPGQSLAAPEQLTITVFKDPYCGCCAGWADHMKRAGFKVEVVEKTDMAPVKKQLGVPDRLLSCHTAVIAGYTIEGHVPAHAVKRLLKQKPNTKGLAVPGMPIGSPGMEGGTPERYDVILFGAGSTKSFGTYIKDEPA